MDSTNNFSGEAYYGRSLSKKTVDRIYENLSYAPSVSYEKENTFRLGKKYFVRDSYKYPYLHINSKIRTSWIVIDIDDPKPIPGYQNLTPLDPLYYEILELPTPNIVMKNNKSGHFQVIYSIAPVYRSPNAKESPKRLLRTIRQHLTLLLSGDNGFNHFKSWNPLCQKNRTIIQLHEDEISLRELYEIDKINTSIDLQNKAGHVDSSDVDLSKGNRNNGIFTALRRWGYRYVGIAKENGISEHEFLNQTIAVAKQINKQCTPTPLADKEIMTISESVSGFCYHIYTGRTKKMEFDPETTTKERQSMAAKRTNDTRASKTISAVQKAAEELLCAGKRITYRAVAQMIGRTAETVSKYKEAIEKAKLEIAASKLDETQKEELVRSVENIDYAVYQILPSNGVVQGISSRVAQIFPKLTMFARLKPILHPLN